MEMTTCEIHQPGLFISRLDPEESKPTIRLPSAAAHLGLLVSQRSLMNGSGAGARVRRLAQRPASHTCGGLSPEHVLGARLGAKPAGEER